MKYSPRNLDSHGVKKVPRAATDSFAIKWTLDWLTLPPGGLVRVRILLAKCNKQIRQPTQEELNLFLSSTTQYLFLGLTKRFDLF